MNDLKEILTPKDLLAVFPCGKNKLYNLLKSGEIKSKRIGHDYYILKDNFLQFIGAIEEKIDSTD